MESPAVEMNEGAILAGAPVQAPQDSLRLPVSQPQATPTKAQLVLTLGRVKTLIKEDADVKFVSSEAYFAITKATELLMEAISERAAARMLQNNRGVVAYDDIAHIVNEWPALDFLRELIPLRVPAVVVLQKMIVARNAMAI